MTHETSLALGDELDVQTEWLQLHHIITDRGSKYSVTAARITNNAELTTFLHTLKKNKHYAKASHNSYALRVQREGTIYESKGDDGETGAGMVILRQLVRCNAVNVCIVVTRWFGGIHLQADRFTHVQDAAKLILAELQAAEATP